MIFIKSHISLMDCKSCLESETNMVLALIKDKYNVYFIHFTQFCNNKVYETTDIIEKCAVSKITNWFNQ